MSPRVNRAMADAVPDVSIVTVSHGHAAELRAHLPGWLAPSDRCARELVVVDNLGRDDAAAAVAALAPGAQLLRNDRPAGFAANCNRGIAASCGRYVLLLNPDVAVHPGALDRLVAFMDAHPEVGIAGPRLLNLDGTLQYSCRRFSTPILFALRGLGLERLLERNPAQRRALMQDWEHDTARDVDWVLGAAMIARRAAVETVGMLDPDYFLYCEDQDWCYRMWTRGYSVFYVPDAVMTHAHRRSSRNPFSRWKWVHARSKLRMFGKQGVSGRRPQADATVDGRTR